MKKTYTVEWSIVLDAENEIEAAKEALEIFKDPDMIATAFDVTDEETDLVYMVDAEPGNERVLSSFLRPTEVAG